MGAAGKGVRMDMESKQITRPPNEDTQTCPRRMNEWGPWDQKPDLDYWYRVGQDRVCSFCGSLHPSDFLSLMKRAAEDDTCRIEPSTKGYKTYIYRDDVKDASQGGIKFYSQHLRGLPQETLDEMDVAYKIAVDRWRAWFKNIRSGNGL